MVGGVKAFILLLVVVLMGGCGGDPNKKANELFVEAVQLITSAEEQAGEAAIKDYEQALGKLGEIISNYKESDLAVKLISGETLFTGKSLMEIKGRVKELKRVAAESVVEEDRPFYINILHDGTYSLDGEIVKLDDLELKLKLRFEEKPDQKLILRGDSKVPHLSVASALAMAQNVGFTSIALVSATEHPQKPKQSHQVTPPHSSP